MLRTRNSGWCNNALVLFIVLELCSLTMASIGSKVEYLPGFQNDGPLPFELETGYIGVGEAEEVQLFYYFVKSERDPSTDPIVLWITGGPGCSSLFALVQEIGPLWIDIKEGNEEGLPTMSLNPHTWTKVANFIFLDLPVRTGFSYATTQMGNHSNNIQAGKHAYQFMHKWLINHPEYLTNPFYAGGDSFSGLIVPVIAHTISDGNEAGAKPWINLKGYILGNAVTKYPEGINYMIPYAYGMGLIPGDLYKSLQKNCKGDYFFGDLTNEPCMQDMSIFLKLIVNINWGSILDAPCLRISGPYDDSNGLRRSLSQKSTLPSDIICWNVWFNITESNWANNESVRKALHVRKGSIGRWLQCNRQTLNFEKNVVDAVPYHANLSARGYRSLVYSGDHDMIVSTLSTQAWIESLNYSIVDNWRPWVADGVVAGYTRSYSNNMSYTTIKGSGHVAPFFTPAECYAMFKRWISGKKL